MSQKFTGTVIRLKNPKTATVELVSTRIHPKYFAQRKFKRTKQVHYEVSGEEINNWLIKYFQEKEVKEISLENNKLVVVYNNNETAPLEKIIEGYELQNIKDYLTKIKQDTLTIQKLKELNNPNSPKTKFPLQLGDKVKIESTCPRSATKRFIVVEKVIK